MQSGAPSSATAGRPLTSMGPASRSHAVTLRQLQSCVCDGHHVAPPEGGVTEVAGTVPETHGKSDKIEARLRIVVTSGARYLLLACSNEKQRGLTPARNDKYKGL